jgi:myosin heavy subunit
LQQQFNTDTFKTETAIYAQEGVADVVGTIEFADNQDVLDIIGGKGGVLRMLDEEVKFGTRGSSASFFQKMCKQHAQPEPKKGKTSKALITTKAHSHWFKVRHFAGIVQYESDSFLEKNKDTMNQDMVDLLAESSDPLVKLLFAPNVEDAAAAEAESKSSGGGRRKKKKGAKTVSSQFRASLNELMKSIKSTESHYIRCIKSNQLKAANTFHEANVLDQLRTGGVFSAADIRTKGFPFRKSHRQFVQHFGVLAYDLDGIEPAPTSDADEQTFTSWCTATVSTCAAASGVNANFSKQIIVGSSMVLYQSAAHQDLEAMRASVLDKAANVCQGGAPGDRQKAFAVFDPSRRGSLTVAEIRHIMTNLGEKVSEDELDALMAKVTVDDKGCITISHLCA